MTTRLVDDTDSQIRYVGAWETSIGDSNESSSTTHGTNAMGDQAIFTFHGSSIAVYGTIRNEIDSNYSTSTPISAYTVDNSSPTLYVGTSNDTILYNQLFYRSPNLDCGHGAEHTLVITFISGSEKKLWLDYFEVVGCRNMLRTRSNISAEPSTVPLPLQSMGEQKNTLLKILLATGITSSVVIIAILFYIFYRRRAKIAILDSRPAARYPSVLSRRPAIRPFRLRASTSPTITPFRDVRFDTAPFGAPQNMYNHPLYYDQSYPPVFSNPRPLRPSHLHSGHTTQGGSFAHEYKRIDGRAVDSSDHDRHFMSMPNSIPGPSGASRSGVETVDRGAPPAYQTTSSCMD